MVSMMRRRWRLRPWGLPWVWTGSDAAIESKDVAFTGVGCDSFRWRWRARAWRSRRIMTGNIGLALAIIVVLFLLALFGVLGLAGGVGARDCGGHCYW